MEWLEKLMTWLFDDIVRMGGFVLVRFPNVKKRFVVYVPTVSRHTFKGRFVHPCNYERSEVARDYGQYDNDIVFNLKTRIPVDMRKYRRGR